jgi:hypothetical protein
MTNYQAAMVAVLAKRSAIRQIQRQRQRQGLRETLPMSVLAAMATEHLEQQPELLLEAAADPIIQELCRR